MRVADVNRDEPEYTRAVLGRRRLLYVGRSDVTKSMTTIPPPFCGYNMA